MIILGDRKTDLADACDRFGAVPSMPNLRPLPRRGHPDRRVRLLSVTGGHMVSRPTSRSDGRRIGLTRLHSAWAGFVENHRAPDAAGRTLHPEPHVIRNQPTFVKNTVIVIVGDSHGRLGDPVRFSRRPPRLPETRIAATPSPTQRAPDKSKSCVHGRGAEGNAAE